MRSGAAAIFTLPRLLISERYHVEVGTALLALAFAMLTWAVPSGKKKKKKRMYYEGEQVDRTK